MVSAETSIVVIFGLYFDSIGIFYLTTKIFILIKNCGLINSKAPGFNNRVNIFLGRPDAGQLRQMVSGYPDPSFRQLCSGKISLLNYYCCELHIVVKILAFGQRR